MEEIQKILEVRRLLNSDTWLTGNSGQKAAAICLWLESWHQVPAGSLPNNDRVLARLSQADDGEWPDVREHALRGWKLCDDGRLYHPVVAEKAIEAWLEKLAQRISSGEGNQKRWNVRFDRAAVEQQMETARRLLAHLNPQSRALTKRRTGRTHGNPVVGVVGNPDGNPVGIADGILDNHPDGSAVGTPDAVPILSQETGTETGTETGILKAKEGSPAAPARGRRQEVTFSAWRTAIGEEPPIPEGDPIFEWADAIRIPHAFLELAWRAFENRYTQSPKRYADWRAAFRDHVRRGFLNVWCEDATGGWRLTTAGAMLKREAEASQ